MWPETIPWQGIFQGYRKRLFDEKLPFRQELVFPDAKSLPVSGILNGLFTAAVFFSQAEALKFYETARNLQYEIPEDLSLLTSGMAAPAETFLSSPPWPFPSMPSVPRLQGFWWHGSKNGSICRNFPRTSR